MSIELKIVCPSCGAVNRAPQERLESGASPVCGRCKANLFDGHPAAIGSESDFEKHISRNDIPVVVDFWAEWCGPCRMMAPQFEAAARNMEPHVRFAKLDTEALQGVSARYGIRGIPTMILFQGGREVARQSGAMNAAQIETWISSQLST